MARCSIRARYSAEERRQLPTPESARPGRGFPGIAANTRASHYSPEFHPDKSPSAGLHLRYETQLLMTLRGQRGWLLKQLVDRAHRFLLTLCALVVWFDHRRVLKHVGHTPRSFVRDCRAVFRMVMHSRAYRPRARQRRDLLKKKADRLRGRPRGRLNP